jgi:hypothetical protein
VIDAVGVKADPPFCGRRAKDQNCGQAANRGRKNIESAITEASETVSAKGSPIAARIASVSDRPLSVMQPLGGKREQEATPPLPRRRARPNG